MSQFSGRMILDEQPVPLKVCLLSAFGAVVAVFFPIIKLLVPSSTEGLGISSFGTSEAAYVTVVSALLWLLSAMSDDKHFNAAAAVFTASAGFFAAAGFSLPSGLGNSWVSYDAYRIWSGYLGSGPIK